MSTDNRIERIETRVDEIKDDVSELKADLRVHMKVIEDHVTGDEKIIVEIQPLLAVIPHIKDMAEEYTFKKKTREKRNTKIKYLALRLGVISTLLGSIVTGMKLFGFF